MSARDVLIKSKNNSYSNSKPQEYDDSQSRQSLRGRSLGGKRRFNPPYKRGDDDSGDSSSMPSKRPRLDLSSKKEERQERNPILDDERVQGMDEVESHGGILSLFID
jgi:hypothetical protein